MSAPDRRPLVFAALATSVLVLVLAVAGHPELLAYASPLLVVALPLVAGRYLGEESLDRMRRGTARPPARRAVPAVPPVRRGFGVVPRGGRLIAAALAERGPPVLVTS
jgi:hypothetical protein